MSIWASWDEVGENMDGYAGIGWDGTPIPAVGSPYTRDALTYQHSAAYPSPTLDYPAFVGISHIPGFIGPPSNRERPQVEDEPVAPYLRLDIATWNDNWDRPMIADGATAVLTRAGVEKLHAQLTEWLGKDMHDD